MDYCSGFSLKRQKRILPFILRIKKSGDVGKCIKSIMEKKQFLVVTGYLKVVKSDIQEDGEILCEVAIPNKELLSVFRKEILTKLQTATG